MKFLLTIAAVIAVASAVPVQRALVTPGAAGPAPIEAPEPIAIGPAVLDFSPVAVGPAMIDFAPVAVGPAIVDASPISVGPAIVDASPISVGPAIIEANPISVGPAIVDFPIPEIDADTVVEFPNFEVEATPIVAPSPVIITPAEDVVESSVAPLVQIILNINQASAPVAPVAVSPVSVIDAAATVEEPMPITIVDSAPEAVNIVDSAPVAVEPVSIVESAPESVSIVDNVPVAVEPVSVVESAPVAAEPVIIGTPIIPAPAVTLPETLN